MESNMCLPDRSWNRVTIVWQCNQHQQNSSSGFRWLRHGFMMEFMTSKILVLLRLIPSLVRREVLKTVTNFITKLPLKKLSTPASLVIKKKCTENIQCLELKPAFLQRPGIGEHKKKDLILLLK